MRMKFRRFFRRQFRMKQRMIVWMKFRRILGRQQRRILGRQFRMKQRRLRRPVDHFQVEWGFPLLHEPIGRSRVFGFPSFGFEY